VSTWCGHYKKIFIPISKKFALYEPDNCDLAQLSDDLGEGAKGRTPKVSSFNHAMLGIKLDAKNHYLSCFEGEGIYKV
jgi:hypothetical protein